MLLHRRAHPLVCVQGGSGNLHGLPYDGRRTGKGKLVSIHFHSLGAEDTSGLTTLRTLAVRCIVSTSRQRVRDPTVA